MIKKIKEIFRTFLKKTHPAPKEPIKKDVPPGKYVIERAVRVKENTLGDWRVILDIKDEYGNIHRAAIPNPKNIYRERSVIRVVKINGKKHITIPITPHQK